MNRKSLTTLLVLAFAGLSASSASAQSLSDLAAWNAQQDAQFFDWAWQGSQEVAYYLPDDVSSSEIIGAMQPYSTEAIYGASNDYWHHLQDRQFDAVENWDTGAIRGEWTYTNPVTDESYLLPYGPYGYHTDDAGYIYEGVDYNDYDSNFYYE